MNIFLSHSSKQKPLVREIVKYLPSHVQTWLDESKLLVGDNIDIRIKDAIELDSDYLVIFIDDYSVKSEWVLKELQWALKHESDVHRNFVIPIVLDKAAWEKFKTHDIGNKLFIELSDYSETGSKSLADKLTSQLFALLSRDLQRIKDENKKESSLNLLEDAEEYINSISSNIKLIIFPYRKNKPLKIYKLFEILKSQNKIGSISWQNFENLILKLQQQGKLAGVVCTGESIYIEEEHYGWKTKVYTNTKKNIAQKAISFIKSGDTISLDAGSTTVEIAEQIGFQLRMHNLFNLNIITNSVSAANVLLKAEGDMGLEDNTNIIQLYMIAGRVRCNTLAIVEEYSPTHNKNSKLNTFNEILSDLGGADVAFVGTNGITKDVGFTTESISETHTKSTMLDLSKRKFIVSDPSKFGIRQSNIFADFSSNIEIITTKEDFEAIVEDYKEYFQDYETSIIYA